MLVWKVIDLGCLLYLFSLNQHGVVEKAWLLWSNRPGFKSCIVSSSVTLGRLLNLSESQFLYLQKSVKYS